MWHPVDLHKGYHAAAGGQASHRGRGRAGYAGHLNVVDLRGMLPSVRSVIGLRQVDGMPHQSPLVSDEAERGRAAPGRRGLSVGRRVSA